MAEDNDQGFIWKVKNGDLEELKTFIVSNASYVTKEINGRQCLHYAADFGQAEIIDFLASHGANINAKDKYGITPLLNAIYENHASCVKTLLEKGADKNGQSPDGVPYIDCAESEEVKCLLK